MGEAMISSLLNSHTVEPKAVTASDPAPQRAKDLETRFGIHATTDNHAAADNAQIVILSVKPQMLRFVFRDLCGKLSKDSLVLSIVAGARVDSMMQGLKHPAIVRSMPNTPAQVGEGMTVWTASPGVTSLQRQEAQAILRAFGKELYVADEVFLCGTGAQISPVTSIDHRAIGKGERGPITAKVSEIYFDAVRGKAAKYRSWITPVYKR